MKGCLQLKAQVNAEAACSAELEVVIHREKSCALRSQTLCPIHEHRKRVEKGCAAMAKPALQKALLTLAKAASLRFPPFA